MNESSPTAIPQSQARLPSWLIALGVSILASLALLLPFFWLGSASGHDFEFHVASWLDVAYQWKQGVLFPRWTAWTNFGFGEPRFIFYPPLSWILGAALSLILPISWVPAAFILLTQTLAGVSAFFLLRRLTANTPAYLGAAFYAANPYALLVSYVRSDFAEQLACAIFPLLLLAALRLVGPLQEEKPKLSTIPLFALPFATVWLCNAPAGVIASYSMALLFGWAALTQRSWKIALRGIAGLALGFGLAGYYLIPAAYEQRWVNIGQALSSGLLPAQNFLFTRIADVEHTWFNWISSLCAIALILLTALTAFASRRFSRGATISTGPKALWDTALLLLGSVATVMMLRLTAALWNLLPEMRFVQFPWRWMSILAVPFSYFLGAAVLRRRFAWIWITAVTAVLLGTAVFLVGQTWWDADDIPTLRAAMAQGEGFEGTDEYDPLGDDHYNLPASAPQARVLPLPDASDMMAPPKIQIDRWTAEDREIRVFSPVAAHLALRLVNYPAWRPEVNGQAVAPESQRGEDADQMILALPAGESRVAVRFTRTPDRTLGGILSLLGLLTWLPLLLWPQGSASRRITG